MAAIQKTEEFRLLSLQPWSAKTKMQGCLRMSFSNYGVDRAPEYDALSYAWGDRKELVEVECNGQSLQITTNLHAALTRLQPSEEKGPRMLWVNAICINQHDPAEKSKQIPLISRTIANAGEVLIWLGLDDENLAVAFQAMEEMAGLIADARLMGEEKNPHVAGLTPRGFRDAEKKIPAVARFF
jgi:hypothetical protein